MKTEPHYQKQKIVNMAANGELVLSDVLCFVKNKYVKVPGKPLKSALVDFYSVESVSEAKIRLLSDIEALKASDTSVKFPHVPQRRAGEDRIVREIDDIFTLFRHLDEQKLVDSLPRYVSADPDMMPSIRLFEGDMNVIMIMLEKLGHKFEEYGSALSTITRDVSALQSKFVSLEQAKVVSLDQFPPLPSVNTTVPVPRPQRQPQPQQQPSVQSLLGNSAHIETNVQPTERGVPDWATLASTPHICSTNRFAPLASTTDDEGTMSGYETVQTKKNKRRRSKESQERATTTAQNPQQRQQQRQRRSALFGKSTVVTNIAAARRLRKKKVYCIDNVDPACSRDDIEAFVNAIPVDIVSCFEAKPRRRRNESEEIPRKAFRLCIYEDERERLLDASIWPDSVIISEWFFKPEQSTQRGERQEQSKKMRLGDVKNGSAAVDAAAIIVTGQSSSSSDCPTVGEPNVNSSIGLSDDTIIAAYTVNMDCTNSTNHGD